MIGRADEGMDVSAVSLLVDVISASETVGEALAASTRGTSTALLDCGLAYTLATTSRAVVASRDQRDTGDIIET